MGILKSMFARRLLAGMLACLWLSMSAAQGAPSMQIDANKIKAGLVYNFLKYTKWDANPDVERNRKLRVCLFGGDPFDGALDPLQGRTAQQLKIDIINTYDPNEVKYCSVVVVNKNQSSALPSLLKKLSGLNILTLSDINGFAKQGGMVELAYREERIRLVINSDAIAATNLKVEDRLLKLSETGGR